MTPLTLLMLVQIMVFCAGSILLYFAGKQDEETRKPLLLIPALMAISLSAGLITFCLVTFASLLIFILPQKVNKVIGKADLLLLMNIAIILILSENLLLSLILYLSLTITIILILLSKNAKKEIPLIHYYSQAYFLAIFWAILGTVIVGLTILIRSFL